MDDEVLQKRFTDCVYFLASPLTCKKGIECEYRHSEIARLNPRDCWYWLGGCCFNPDCPFRHPPLEGFKEAHGESSDPKNAPASVPLNKTNIPCYFYSNGYCIKGDKCSFLHGPSDGSVSFKSSKAEPTVNNGVPCEKKLSAGSNTDPSKTAQIEQAHTERKPALDSPQLASVSPERSESPDISATQCQENVVNGFVQSESDVYDQSSDQIVNGYGEREGWLESSPGFDVLVEGESERLGYERDVDFFSDHDEEGRELDIHYADPNEYDPAYPELGIPQERYYDVYDRLEDNKRAPRDYLGGQSRESIFYRLSFQKRKAEPIFNGPDLREHLKKCKVDDSFHNSPHSIGHRDRRYPRRRGSRGEIDFDPRGSRLRKAAPVNRYKRLGKPQFHSSEVLRERKPALQQKRKSRVESTVFTGPKTLDQIKEEKKKSLQNGDLVGAFNKTESDGFQGPRPLSEILKNKRKLG